MKQKVHYIGALRQSGYLLKLKSFCTTFTESPLVHQSGLFTNPNELIERFTSLFPLITSMATFLDPLV